MTDRDWQELRKAAEFVSDGGAKRVDGGTFKVYSVPTQNIVRVDININPKEG